MVTQPQSTLTSSSAQLALLRSTVLPLKKATTFGATSANTDVLVSVVQVPLTATTVGQLAMNLKVPQTVPDAVPRKSTTSMETSALKLESPTSAMMPVMALATGVSCQALSGMTIVLPAGVCPSNSTHLPTLMVTESAVQMRELVTTHATAEPVGQSMTHKSGFPKTPCAAVSQRLSSVLAVHVTRMMTFQICVVVLTVTTATRVGSMATLLAGNLKIKLAGVCPSSCASASTLTHQTSVVPPMPASVETTALIADGRGLPLTPEVLLQLMPCADAGGGENIQLV